MTRSREAAVRDLLSRAVRAGAAPGLVAAWQTAGNPAPTVVAMGWADLGPPSRPATSATIFDLASITKPFAVTTLFLLARRNGRLDLESTAGQVLPEIADRPLGSSTVRSLLTHTSGLPSWAPLYALAEGRADRVTEVIGTLALESPDHHVVYSCPGFILLGRMLERTAGQTLDRLFDEQVAEPMGLAPDLGYCPEPDSHRLAGGAATPEAERALVLENGLEPRWIPTAGRGLPDDGNARFLAGVAGNAGLFGSVTAVLTLASAFLPDGSLLRDDEAELATRNYTPGLEQARGLGWQLAGSPGCSAGTGLFSDHAFGHTGFTGTSVWVDPTRRLVMALLANRVHPGHRTTDLHPLRRRFHELVLSFGS